MIRNITTPASSEYLCPSCRSPMKSGSVLCIECGFDTRTGQKISSKHRSKRGEPIHHGIPILIQVYGYIFMILFGGTALLTLVGMCLIFFLPNSDLPADMKSIRRGAACSGTLLFLVCCALFSLGEGLRKGRRASILGLLILFILTLAGGILMILPAFGGYQAGPGTVAGIYVVAIGTVLFVPPLVVGVSRWRQLD